jgi:predicted MFS family arabinose efflux permease
MGYYKSAHIFGCILAMAGYTIVFSFSTDKIVPFCLGTTLIGFADVLSCLKIYVKEEYGGDAVDVGYRIKVQTVFNMLGVTFGFWVGGYVYQNYGIKGIALLGMAGSALELISIFIYFVLLRNK